MGKQYINMDRDLVQKLRGAEVVVLGELIGYAMGRDHCSPSISLIASKVAYCERTVRRALHSLHQKHIIDIEEDIDIEKTREYKRRHNKPNIYHLVYNKVKCASKKVAKKVREGKEDIELILAGYKGSYEESWISKARKAIVRKMKKEGSLANPKKYIETLFADWEKTENQIKRLERTISSENAELEARGSSEQKKVTEGSQRATNVSVPKYTSNRQMQGIHSANVRRYAQMTEAEFEKAIRAKEGKK